MDTTTGLKEQIQEKYGAAARLAASGAKDASCCSGTSCCGAEEITENLYSDGERGTLPDAAVAATSSSSKARSNRSRCPTARWTSSSPTA